MRMKRIFPFAAAFLCAAAACFQGCKGPGRQFQQAPLQQAFTRDTRTYVLGREPDQDREQAFQDLLSKAHGDALKNSGLAPDVGFSYSLSPKGTVYPFSEVEVACLVQKQDYSRGKALCRQFFRAVDAGLRRVTAPKEP